MEVKIIILCSKNFEGNEGGKMTETGCMRLMLFEKNIGL